MSPKKLGKVADNLQKEITKNLEIEMMIQIKKEISSVK